MSDYLTEKKKKTHDFSKSELVDIEIDEISGHIHKAYRVKDDVFLFEVPNDIFSIKYPDRTIAKKGIYKFTSWYTDSVTLLDDSPLDREYHNKYKSVTRSNKIKRLFR